MAHIVSSSDDGPRADPHYPPELRDAEENLILLCPDHHDIVDVQENSYTCDDLRQWKREHAEWATRGLQAQMPAVGFEDFEELAALKSALVAAPSLQPETFTIVPPEKKIKRNRLSGGVRYEITLALSKAREVEQFVEYMTQRDPDFPERLRQGFVEEYEKQRGDGLDGDALFVSLREFASGRNSDFRQQAAGLAVLVYLFEKCEVFEK